MTFLAEKNPPDNKPKNGWPEMDLLTEVYCITNKPG